MLRSFHYAAHGTLLNPRVGGAVRAERRRAASSRGLASGTCTWSAAFLRGYLRGRRRRASSCPRDDDELARLLDAFLLEKALYELGYELNNRPDWVSIPLRGIPELLAS